MPTITVNHRYDLPLSEVFAALSHHETFNLILWPLRSERAEDAPHPSPPDGVGSVRKMGFPPLMPIREEILKIVDGELIEYAMRPNPIFSQHLGRLVFLGDEAGCELVYSISLESRLPLIDRLVLGQLKLSLMRGLPKLESALRRSHFRMP